MRVLLPLLLCILAAPALADRPYKVEYTVHYNGFKVGEMHQRYLPQSGGSWLLETKVKTTGLVSWFNSDTVVETSVVDFVNSMPRPKSYRYHYSGNKKDVVERLNFDWQKKKVSSLRDGKTSMLPINGELQDKQSYQVAMRRALQNGETDFTYSVVDRGKVEQYKLQVVGEESQVTTFGTVDTVVVKKGTTTMWLAKDYDYLVVKIEQKEDDNLATSYITSKKPFAVGTNAIPPAVKTHPPQ